MEKVYTKEEHDKCKRVAEAFQELYMLSASAHKFNGPKGIGFLYVKRGTKISSFADGGAQEFHKRAGTENIASIVGMSIALKKSCDEMEKVNEKLLIPI